ncbi:cytochrome P450 [Rhodovulum imhoffii]|uniref:Cytochrome P450 n=1 Tax=Rhodovulum imhoffii TaxID=365340 RepID=A0A2T5BNU1_9RHOB|nr:cytochrome P450 [Rhodovulum imhoffii]MBK5932943.1 cytochrome P450 [Rhodovulum imhoffii]PTN00634.1 cytochrome P450 [Rhodovulum imhoffii]
MTQPPKPAPRDGKITLAGYIHRFRADMLSAHPAKLYRAKMAEFRTPFFRSYMVNQPDLIRCVLRDRPMEFPKSDRVGAGLRPLLGNSVFLTNGETWLRQRRIIDPAFEGGRLRDTFPAMLEAARATVARFVPGETEVEAHMSHAAADVIFRTLFSIPIEDETAQAVFHQFRAYQRSQPLVNLAAFLGPRWVPRLHGRRTRASARAIRRLILQMTTARKAQIASGTAPDDLATKIMTTRDPETGETFDAAEMVDQVAIFFLAGHETSASALAWALYLLAISPEAQVRAAQEADSFPDEPEFGDLKKLPFIRDVFREALRLYPPVPMMVRETTRPERFRNRDIPVGSQIVLSPWHLHRHSLYWSNPDGFDPDRYTTADGKACLRDAFIPFSAGPRVCTGAGFAMAEAVLILALILRRWRLDPVPGREPVPVAYLTVRAREGIWLRFSPRA